jgi:hypothetical protein
MDFKDAWELGFISKEIQKQGKDMLDYSHQHVCRLLERCHSDLHALMCQMSGDKWSLQRLETILESVLEEEVWALSDLPQERLRFHSKAFQTEMEKLLNDLHPKHNLLMVIRMMHKSIKAMVKLVETNGTYE